ncbi:cold-shock' DNA-binding domain-containing protein [Halteromyces radiatus]|uniref:cold-shock' DNA-binding domain-containing protein n=1 Tax=Halteromyces radiatus TaxID=101107 RepID=UPI00221EDEFF|nr:cold-shock' DNA-binding domain-containing protein [Halteromyces radiatus]KAI8099462.1 cold-shock' DNA-binding domain-containing protein [Halteromyces radiatus]
MATTEGRKTGRVKFFNSMKGYGFIIPDDQMGQNDVEVFVHHTAIQNAGGFKSLNEGEEVEYDLVQGGKGMQAAMVTAIGGGPVKGDARANQRTQYQNNGGGYGGGRNQYNSGYAFNPYPDYRYPMPYVGGAGAAGGNQGPLQGFQYGQPMGMYGGGQQPFGYQQPTFGLPSQHQPLQQHQQPHAYGSPRPDSPDHHHHHHHQGH